MRFKEFFKTDLDQAQFAEGKIWRDLAKLQKYQTSHINAFKLRKAICDRILKYKFCFHRFGIESHDELEALANQVHARYDEWRRSRKTSDIIPDEPLPDAD